MKTLDDYLIIPYCDIKRNFTMFCVVESFCKKDDPDLKRLWTRVLMCSIASIMVWDGEY